MLSIYCKKCLFIINTLPHPANHAFLFLYNNTKSMLSLHHAGLAFYSLSTCGEQSRNTWNGERGEGGGGGGQDTSTSFAQE